MLRIEVTMEAYLVIAASLGETWFVQPRQENEMGMVYLWLDHRTVEQMRGLRLPGEGYSDVILRLARAEADAA